MSSVSGVIFDGGKKPTNALLIIVVLLALKDDLTRTISEYKMASVASHSYLLATVNKLVAAILREVILCECLAAVLNLFASNILMFLRNAVGQSILKASEILFHRIELILTFSLWKRLLSPDFCASVFGSVASLYRCLSKKKITTDVSILSYRSGFACHFLGTAPCLIRSLTRIEYLFIVLYLQSRIGVVANGTIG